MTFPARSLRTLSIAATLVAVPLVIMGAASAQKSEPRSFVYGNITIPGKKLQKVELVRPRKVRRPSARVLPDGDFYFEDVEPGEWFLMRFMAGGEWYNVMSRDVEQNLTFRVIAKPGAVHYLGSWAVTGEKDNRFKPDEFSMRAVKGRQRPVATRLATALKDSPWLPKLRRSLAR